MRLLILLGLESKRTQVHHRCGEELRQTIVDFESNQSPLTIAHFEQLVHVGQFTFAVRQITSLTGHFRLPKSVHSAADGQLWHIECHRIHSCHTPGNLGAWHPSRRIKLNCVKTDKTSR